jgi:hypothetical protein
MALVQLNWRPVPRTLRQFGGIALLAFGLLGVVAWWRGTLLGLPLAPTTAEAVGSALLILGGASGLLAAIAPRAVLPLYLAMSVVTAPIGFLLSHVLLFLLFFGLFTPLGVVMRLFGCDPMRLARHAAGETYWAKRRGAPSPARYFHQY